MTLRKRHPDTARRWGSFTAALTVAATLLTAVVMILTSSPAGAETPAERCKRETAAYNNAWKNTWAQANPGKKPSDAPKPPVPYKCGGTNDGPLPTLSPDEPDKESPTEVAPAEDTAKEGAQSSADSTEGPSLVPPTERNDPASGVKPDQRAINETRDRPVDDAAKPTERKPSADRDSRPYNLRQGRPEETDPDFLEAVRNQRFGSLNAFSARNYASDDGVSSYQPCTELSDCYEIQCYSAGGTPVGATYVPAAGYCLMIISQRYTADWNDKLGSCVVTTKGGCFVSYQETRTTRTETAFSVSPTVLGVALGFNHGVTREYTTSIGQGCISDPDAAIGDSFGAYPNINRSVYRIGRPWTKGSNGEGSYMSNTAVTWSNLLWQTSYDGLVACRNDGPTGWTE